MNKNNLKSSDLQVYNILKSEELKQQNKLSLIPSENFSSLAVRQAVGSVFMNKYSEGYPNKRYYEGNLYIDELENLAIERAKKLFKLPADWGVNVQAHSGSEANLAVYLGLLNPGDKILSMYLPDGGHLSHGWSYEPKKKQNFSYIYKGGSRKVNATSKFFNSIQYKTDPKTGLFNYQEIETIAKAEKPKLIITGGTAYPREISYKKMKQIAQKVNAYYLADIAHEAGLVAGEAVSSPIGIADVVTFTTHKTLRATRGAIIMAKGELIESINKAVFPGLQGGPHNHSIAGIAVGLKEASSKSFKTYAKNIVINAKMLASELINKGFDVVSGGTDKHLILIDLRKEQLYGKKLAKALDYAGIIANMNTIPNETRAPADPSGIRLGTPIVTTRGMKAKEMKMIAEWIKKVLDISVKYKDLDSKNFEIAISKDKHIKLIAKEVEQLCKKFPLEI